MPDLAATIQIARDQFSAQIVAHGQQLRFVQAHGGAQFDFLGAVRGIKPDEYEIADLTQHDMRVKCRIVEFTAAGVEPIPGDVIHVQGLDRLVLGVAPLAIQTQIVGYGIFIRG